MQIEICHIFQPTAELSDLAVGAGQQFLSEATAWSVKVSDRVGAEVQVADLKAAFWAVFTAQLIGDEQSVPGLTAFRERCLQLEFDGCWTHTQIKFLGLARDLLEEAAEARSFLSEQGRK